MPEQDYSEEPVISARQATIGDDLPATTDSGSAPVKIGAIFRTTAPTYTDGQRTEIATDNRGNLKTAIVQGATQAGIGALSADALAAPTALQTEAFTLYFNGATWDRGRTPNVFKNLNAVVITSETTIWTPTAGKKFRLMGMLITQGVVTGAITLKDNTAGTTIAIIPPHTIGVCMGMITFGNGILSATINNVLTATGASTETITGMVFGTEE